MTALKANRELRKFSKTHGHRLVTMAFEPEQGGSVALEGCVLLSDAGEVAEMFRRLIGLTAKVEDPEPEPVK